MPGPHELVLVIAEAHELEAQERGSAEVEAGPAFGGAELGEVAGIEHLERKPDLLADDLQRLGQASPREGRAEDGVALHEHLPRRAERTEVERPAQAARELLHVHVRRRRGDAVKEHPLLHGRERISVVRGRGHDSWSKATCWSASSRCSALTCSAAGASSSRGCESSANAARAAMVEC